MEVEEIAEVDLKTEGVGDEVTAFVDADALVESLGRGQEKEEQGGDSVEAEMKDAIDDDAEEMEVEAASVAEAADANGQSGEVGEDKEEAVAVTDLTALDEVGEVWL